MKALLVLSAYLAPLADRRTFASGTSIFLLLTVGPPLFGALVVLLAWLRIPTHPVFWLLVAGLSFWFGEFTQRFVRAHQAEIVARSQTRPWPRTSAAALLAGAFLLFAGLAETAGWLNGRP